MDLGAGDETQNLKTPGTCLTSELHPHTQKTAHLRPRSWMVYSRTSGDLWGANPSLWKAEVYTHLLLWSAPSAVATGGRGVLGPACPPVTCLAKSQVVLPGLAQWSLLAAAPRERSSLNSIHPTTHRPTAPLFRWSSSFFPPCTYT